jgi:hypothetical protein
MINCKGLGSGRGLIEVLARHLLEAFTKTIKILNQDSRCPGRDSNPEPSKYKSTRYHYASLLGHIPEHIIFVFIAVGGSEISQVGSFLKSRIIIPIMSREEIRKNPKNIDHDSQFINKSTGIFIYTSQSVIY